MYHKTSYLSAFSSLRILLVTCLWCFARNLMAVCQPRSAVTVWDESLARFWRDADKDTRWGARCRFATVLFRHPCRLRPEACKTAPGERDLQQCDSMCWQYLCTTTHRTNILLGKSRWDVNIHGGFATDEWDLDLTQSPGMQNRCITTSVASICPYSPFHTRDDH